MLKFILIQLAIYKFCLSLDIKSTEWVSFKREFNLSFASQDHEVEKFKTFQTNKKLVDEHNKNKHSTFKLKLNKKSLYSNDEFRRIYSLRLNLSEHFTNLKAFANNRNSSNYASRPDYINWVEAGVVSPVRNQGACGSCYSFSTVAGYESHYAIRTNNLVVLSVQQIVDCSMKYPYDNDGCEGGEIGKSLMYITNYGLETEEAYPYKTRVSKCKYENSKARYRLTGSTYIYRNLNVMHNILISRGPIIAYISGLLSSFQFYASGVYNDRNCPNDFSKLNHVVLIVGYGTDNQTGENYWLAKNSWGDKWGENGYVRIARGVNMCGIEILSYYPIL